MSKSLNVKVFCRIRPENEKEILSGAKGCLNPLSETSIQIIGEQKQDDQKGSFNTPSSQEFTFDTVFPSSSSQPEIFEKAAKPLIDSAMQGINGTLFCYGQTSSGKTFTMEGIREDNNLKGIIPRMMEYIFDLIPKASSDIEFSVKCQYYQIYNEKIQDLLDTRKTDLSIREDKTKGIWVEDCSEVYVTSKEEMYNVFQCGSNNRTVSATEMNKGSSRSHSLFSVTLFQRNTITGSTQSGKLYFVDLAGSEKMSKTGIEGGMGLKEAQNINKSLMTLGMVINALTEGASHIPYRDSKLTRVLQESLGGNSQTTLIITCSPSMLNQSESLSTLRFGQRAKLIKNKVVANTQKSAKELLIQLNKANLKIKQLESIIGKIEKGEINHNELLNENNNNENNSVKKKEKCEECTKLSTQIAYLNLELLTSQEENDELIKDKEDLENEISEKNKTIFDMNDKVQQAQQYSKTLLDEQGKIFNDIQFHMETHNCLVKKIQTSIESLKSSMAEDNINNVEIIEDYLSLSLKNWHELLGQFGIDSQNYQSNNSTIELNNSSFELSSRSTQIVGSINFHINKNINIKIGNKIKRRNTVNYLKSRKNAKSQRMKDFTIVELNQHNKHLVSQLSSTKENLSKCRLSLSQKEIIISHQTEEISSLQKKITEFEEILKALTEKLLKKENEFDQYKEKTLKDFSHKEQKTVELINRITDLEDENYKLLHFSAKDADKRKYIMMDKQIKSFTVEMQKMINENIKYKNLLSTKEVELLKLKNEIAEIRKEQSTKNTDISFANKDTVISNETMSQLNKPKTSEIIRKSFESSRSNGSSNSIEFVSKRDNSFESIASSRMIKVIRGGNKKQIGENGFFSAFLDSKPLCTPVKALKKKSIVQFEKEMNMLDNDDLSDISN